MGERSPELILDSSPFHLIPYMSHKIYPEDILLPKNTANLPVTSKVLLGLIVVVKKDALIHQIGKVDEEHMTQVDAVLQRLLGVSN